MLCLVKTLCTNQEKQGTPYLEKIEQNGLFSTEELYKKSKIYPLQSFSFNALNAPAHPSSGDTSLMRVKKKHAPLLFITLIVWGIGVSTMKEQKHRI